MNTQTLLENFSTLADAPGGIPRLRELILDLAVRGQLIPHTGEQDTEVSCHGQPFPIPDTWSWKAFSELVEFKVGKTPPTKDPSFWGNESSTMWVSIGDMVDGGTVNASNRTITKKAQKEVFKREPWPTGTMLMSFKLTIGKVSRLGQPAFFNEAIFSFNSGDESINEYLFRVLPLLAQSGDSKGAIKGNTLNSESISKLQIPLPPENQRTGIVTRIDELMALCDQLEAAKAERDSLRTAARKSAIDAVSTASIPDELSTAWARIRDNWTTYADTPESISDLRSITLDLALQGRLSSSSSASDTPVQTLLDHIREQHKPHGDISRERFSIPDHWEWVALGTIADHQLGKMLNKSRTAGASRKYLRTANVASNGGFDLSEIKEMLVPHDELDKYSVRKGDLFVNEGGDVGKSAIWTSDADDFAFQNHLHRLRPLGGIASRFLQIVLQQARNAGALLEMSAGVTIQNLSANTIRKLACPLPPLEEQERIIARVDELMALCDQLENELKTRNNFAVQWAASVVHHIGDAA